jgi:hypothetical protein
MAWLSDEAWEMVSDSIDKKKTAQSARSTRTHCGRRGAVKFPSDYLTKKERNAMNGDVKEYRMNDPMTWDEFKEMPVDLQKLYIEGLRKKFQVPDAYIAEMLGKDRWSFGDHLFKNHIPTGKDAGVHKVWDREGFMAWRLGIENPNADPVPVEETTAEPIDILDRPMTFAEFKNLTDEQKKEYIERLRKKFDVPNVEIAKMMGTSQYTISRVATSLKAEYGRSGGSRLWNKGAWDAWMNQDNSVETSVVENNDISDADTAVAEMDIVIDEDYSLTPRDKEKIDEFVKDLAEIIAEVTTHEYADHPELPKTCPVPIMPMSGTMTFQGDVDDILATLKTLLSGTRNKLTVTWEPMEG